MNSGHIHVTQLIGTTTRRMLLAILPILSISIARASDRLDPDLLKSVVRIEIPGDFVASGFLVGTGENQATSKQILITNKHVIGDWNLADGNIQQYNSYLDVFFYRINDPSGASYRATRISIAPAGKLDAVRVHVHPNPRIDLVAIDVTDKVMDPNEHIASTTFRPSFLLAFDKIQSFYTDIGDEVFALGYPLGIRSVVNDYPIAKMGDLSSRPGETVAIPFKGAKRDGSVTDIMIEGKFLVVDGLITGGNSGGPVVLVGGMRTSRDPKTNQLQFLTQPMKNMVLGVVSSILGPSGLAVVVSSDYINDLLSSFEKTK